MQTRLTLLFIFIIFHTSYSFMILVAWWDRSIWRRRIWWTWIWIRFIWYVWYRIGWVFVRRRIFFRCHDFWLWVVWCWSRVTWCTICKYLWSRYQRSCMYQMYWRWKHLFYCTNIGLIVDWSDIFQIDCNRLIWVGVIQINVNRVRIFVIPNYTFFCAQLFNYKVIFALSFLGDFLPPRFSLPIFVVPCHGNFK